METLGQIEKLEPNTLVLVGDRLIPIPADVAEKYKPGDSFIAVRKTGEILYIPCEIRELVTEAVTRAVNAFNNLTTIADDQITSFYNTFANHLANDEIWAEIARVNSVDVERAKEKGRSTTRLVADEKMRRNMIEGLVQWRDMPPVRNKVIERIEHDGWVVEQVAAGCGVVAFVFEGRPNVLADATGVLRSGNTAVFRIGSDALETARAMMRLAVKPSLVESGLPADSVVLIESAEHCAGWALFADPRLALAVARGSGRATQLLGAIAAEAGNATSLHGTGGAWIIADETADPTKFELAVFHSTDRKVCNTVNVICIHRSRRDLVEKMLQALARRGEKLGYGYRLHVARGSEGLIPSDLFHTETDVMRATGVDREPIASMISIDKLGHEWEWEQTPEVSFVGIDSLDEGIRLFNEESPLFACSLISERAEAHEHFFRAVNSPFVGNGFTRWVDGQYALHRPELGISSWQNGRLLGRCGILTGDGVFTIRLRAIQTDPDVHR